jgi:hypothetical protein
VGWWIGINSKVLKLLRNKIIEVLIKYESKYALKAVLIYLIKGGTRVKELIVKRLFKE